MLDDIVNALKESLRCKAEDVIILSVTSVPDGVVVVWRRWVTEHVHEHRMTLITKEGRASTNMLAQVTR